jgi:hypothetical protein
MKIILFHGFASRIGIPNLILFFARLKLNLSDDEG